MKTENSRFDDFKNAFDESFGKVTPQQFVKRMEDLGYKFQPATLPPEEPKAEEPKQNFNERYDKIKDSEWFKNGYHNKSLGETMGLEEEKEGKSAEEIKSKEQILSKHTMYPSHYDIRVMRAMEEYAQQFQSTPISNKEHSLKFAEWINESGYRKSRIDGIYWTTEETHKHFSTKEIYEQFLSTLNTL